MTTVLYHANCYDGFGSAWAAYQEFGEAATYQPVKYGEPIPEIPDSERVLIVDFSYPRDVLVPLAERCDLTVLDHHKTAEAELAGLPFCTFNMHKSGAMLTYEHMFPQHIIVPPLIEYIQDRDLWRFFRPGSREIHAWLTSWPMNFDTWDDLDEKLLTDLDSCVTEGTALLRLERQQTERIADAARWMEIVGYKVPVTNASLLFSEVPELLCERHPEAPFAAYYVDRADGKRQWGLRSRGEFDVSEIAKKYGGGGHRNASGFVTEIPRGEDVLGGP